MYTLHVIAGLGNGSGGAEKILCDLLTVLNKNENDVLSFGKGNYYREKITLVCRKLIHGNPLKSTISLIASTALPNIFQGKYDCVTGWMYYGSLICYLLGFKSRRIIFYIHNAEIEKDCTTRMLRLVYFLCGTITRLDNRVRVIYCSERSRLSHEATGWKKCRGTIIVNGVTISGDIRPDVRSQKKFKIGHLGRYHPVKDHELLLKTLSELRQLRTGWHCYLGGPELDSNNNMIIRLIQKYKVSNYVTLLGTVDNTEEYYKDLDLFLLTSRNESCPLVVLEALCYGIKCISTDVGDLKDLIANDGKVIEGREPKKMANAIASCMVYESHAVRAERAIRNISRFNIHEMARRYMDLARGS